MEWKDIAIANLSEQQDFSVVGDQVQLETRQTGVWAGFGRTLQRWFGEDRTSLAHVFERVTASIQQDQEVGFEDIDQLLKVRTIVQQRSNKFSRMNWISRRLGGHGNVKGSCAQLLKATDLKIFNLLSGKELTLEMFSEKQQKTVTDMLTFLHSPAPALEECERFQQELRELCPDENDKEAFATERLQALADVGFSGAKFEQVRLAMEGDKEVSYSLSSILLQEPRTIDEAAVERFGDLVKEIFGEKDSVKVSELANEGFAIAQYIASLDTESFSDEVRDRWLSEAANAGMSAAQYQLANKIEVGHVSIEIPLDISSTFLKEKAALQGHREAILDIGRRLSSVVSQATSEARSEYYKEGYTLEPVTVRQLLYEMFRDSNDVDVEAALVFGGLCAGNVDVRIPEQSPIIARYADQELFADLWFGSTAERFLDERQVLKLSGADEESLKLHVAGFVLMHGLFGLDPVKTAADRIYEVVESFDFSKDRLDSEPSISQQNVNDLPEVGLDSLSVIEEEDRELLAAIAASLAGSSEGYPVLPSLANNINKAIELSQQESHVDSLEREFIESLLLEQEFAVRATPDDGDCLFAACLAEGDEHTPADLRKAVYGYMAVNSDEVGFAIYNELTAEVEAYRTTSSEAERVRIISKLPPTFAKKLNELDPTQDVGELLWPWYEDRSAEGMVQNYLKEMAEGKYYAGQVEWLALSKVIGKPIRVYSRAIGEAQDIPWDAAYSREDFVHLYYDSRHRHYERLVPTTSKERPDAP